MSTQEGVRNDLMNFEAGCLKMQTRGGPKHEHFADIICAIPFQAVLLQQRYRM